MGNLKLIPNRQPNMILTWRNSLRRIILFLSVIPFITSCNSSAEYQPIPVTSEPVIITGSILNKKNDKDVVTAYVRDILSGKQSTYVGLVDSLGDFQIKFDQYYSHDIMLRYDQDAFSILVHPSDSIHVEFDAKLISDKKELVKTIQFSGDGAETNSKLMAYQSEIYKVHIPWEKYCQYEKEKSAKEFEALLDSLKSVKENVVNNFIKEFNPSEELKTWMKYDVVMDYNIELSMYPYDHAKFNNLDYKSVVTSSFYDFMNISFPHEALINSKSNLFINRNWTRNSAIMHENGDDYFCEGIIGFFMQFNSGYSYGSMTEAKIEVILNNIDDEFLKEINIANELFKTLERREIKEFEKHFSLFDKVVKEPFLREPLINKYLKTKQHFENPKQETNTVLKLAKSTPANELLNEIIEDHKGKVIYLDIWATWCGPCRKEMPNSQKLEKKLDDDNVAFVYLCIDSKEEQWKALISEMNLGGSHYFASSDQSRFVCKLFEMNGVPEYVLIDQKGNIDEKGFHLRPSNGSIGNKIENLLKE